MKEFLPLLKSYRVGTRTANCPSHWLWTALSEWTMAGYPLEHLLLKQTQLPYAVVGKQKEVNTNNGKGRDIKK